MVDLTPVALSNATFMDYASYGSNAAPPSGGTRVTNYSINVALTLQRQNDPTALLTSDWATRQAALADQANIWATYGANPTDYVSATNVVTNDLGLSPAGAGFVATTASRTIWLTLNGNSSVGQDDFRTLFNAQLYELPNGGAYYWADANGNPVNLSLAKALVDLGVTGVAFDDQGDVFFEPYNADASGQTPAILASGSQSPGNASSAVGDLYPQQIAQDIYNYPLQGALWDPNSPTAVPTGPIGLIEPGLGDAQSGSSAFQELLDAYRQTAFGSSSVPGVVVNSVAVGGQAAANDGERALDVGVVTAVNPQSQLVLYAGSGPNSSDFAAYQSAIWDESYNAPVITSSWGLHMNAAPGSPFRKATLDVLTDAALRNISMFIAAGDGGSGNENPNGVTNVDYGDANPYAVTVGGTSVSTRQTALADPGLMTAYGNAAMAGDPSVIWQLVAGGLTSVPSQTVALQRLIEAVWNKYTVTPDAHTGTSNIYGYDGNNAGTGGVDPTQPVPAYQQAFGLDPTTTDGRNLSGRGVPDVSAIAGGNMAYIVPPGDMQGTTNNGGTSAATPLWASLASQINAVFADQGLPQLGYMNDLLYVAAVVDPGSFNDITIGNDTSTFLWGGTQYTVGGDAATPTGYGYSAGPGYDLVTGLGTPNGLLLARALTQIAHSEVSFSSASDVIVSDNAGGWQAGTSQSLLFQTMAGNGAAVGLDIGGTTTSFSNATTQPFAWSSRMAQQSLQSDFDADLVTMFDGESQGTLVQATVGSGTSITVNINAAATQAKQATLSQGFGFADFMSSDGASAVRVAQSVAVAETAGGADNQQAIARIRQGALSNNLSLEFYRVDDYEGTVVNGAGTFHPGDAGYLEAAEGRAYQLSTGGTTIAGPGYGNYSETDLQGVNAGDLVAMLLRNASSTFFAFAPANETVRGQNVSHLWNYGANTWGWEDAWGGGDRDYNDVVVQLDFTSKSGNGLLVGQS